jgi:hypothetical protein
MPLRRSVTWVVVLIVAGACDSPKGDLPEITKPLEYETVRLELPSCDTRLPPVRDGSRCGATEIGKSIDPNDVCLLLTALNAWVKSGPGRAPSMHEDDWPRVRSVHAGDWPLVRAVCVVRSVMPEPIDERPSGKPATKAPWPYMSSLWMAADIPHRSLIIFVEMSEQSRERKYSVALRKPGFSILSDSGG